jgi:hypothetical protein
VQLGAMEVCVMAPQLIFAIKYFASLDAGKISPMLVCHVVCKSHLGLAALITLGAGEGFPLLGHLHQTLGNPPSFRPGTRNV